MKIHILERVMFFVIVCTIVFVGLYLYTLLVSIYQSHLLHVLASNLGDGTQPTASCGISARWTPIESSQQLDRGRSSPFQSHASFVLPAGASGNPETSQFLLSLQDRHAIDIVYFDQPGSTSAAAAVIEVKCEEFHESEETQNAELNRNKRVPEACLRDGVGHVRTKGRMGRGVSNEGQRAGRRQSG